MWLKASQEGHAVLQTARWSEMAGLWDRLMFFFSGSLMAGRASAP